MTKLLQEAIAELKKLPIEQQNAIASRILAELKNDANETLVNTLASTEAVIWSPQTDDKGFQALSDLLSGDFGARQMTPIS
ncbi:MAG: hypothetical protein QNJ41_17135 [Xenococcaceae cyanobacterium MO_188.B32]|nr:hypothetical protein [Xenococcaceae cyanobacterium MO_188.B32]